jgi:hypothetical protein
VLDHATGQPVAGAVVTSAPDARDATGAALTATDDDGRFELTLPAGRRTLAITAPWLLTARIAVAVDAAAPRQLTIEVDDDPAALGREVIELRDTAPTAPGQSRVDAALGRAAPGGGDAAKVVQAMPGVARPPAGSSDLVVWGAAPRETRVFVDGVPVPALYHLGGYRAAIGDDLVGAVGLTPAAFGVDRGGAIGGVVDVTLAGQADLADLPAWRVRADLLDGAVAGRATLGGATVAAAARTSWLDRAVGAIEDPRRLAPNAPLPRWSDGQLVVRDRLADDLVVDGWLLGALDRLDRTLASDDPATATTVASGRHTVRGQLTLRQERATGAATATVWAGHDRASDDLTVGLTPASALTTAWVGGARLAEASRLAEAATLTLGADLDGEAATLRRAGSLTIPAREGDVAIFGQPPGDAVAADGWQATTIDAAGHAALELHAGRLAATVGVRGDGWLLGASRATPRIGATPARGSQRIDYTADPRLAVQLRLAPTAVLRLDAGHYHQARAAADTSAVFGTPDLGLEDAWHLTVGGQWHDGPLALEAALYARQLAALVARDPAVNPPLAAALTQDGAGEVRGLQVTARLTGWRDLTGWLTYGLSESTRRDVAGGPARPFDHDQRHNLIAVATWRRGAWTVGGRLRVASGEPRTAVIGAYFDSRAGRYEPLRGAHNGVTLPTFAAADVRIERRLDTGAVRGALYLEVQNLTGRHNAEELIYSADYGRQGYLTSLPLLAIVGVRIER